MIRRIIGEQEKRGGVGNTPCIGVKAKNGRRLTTEDGLAFICVLKFARVCINSPQKVPP